MTEVIEKGLRKIGVTASKPILAIICIVLGILVIVFPWLLAIIVGIFLLVEGLFLFIDYLETPGKQ